MRDEKSGKESKQVNFRIDPDSAEAFRLFCTTHGMNQAQGFDHLIQVLELNNAKAATPGRAVEIENFERLLKEILSAYIGSIELSSNAEARVLERFQSDLKRKDKTIDELREKVETIAGGTGPDQRTGPACHKPVRVCKKSYCGSGRDQSYPSGTKSAASGEGLQV